MTEEEINEGRNVIFENNNFIFMEILDANSAKYFGGKDFYDSWSRKYRNGDLYFIIDRINYDDSISIFIPSVNTIQIFTFKDNELSLTELLKKYPFVYDTIMDKVNPFSMGSYYALKAIANGVKPLSDWTMQHADVMIENFKYIAGNPRNSIVELEFDSVKDYLETFEMSDDSIWVIDLIMSNYGEGFEFNDLSDDYSWREDGYLLDYFNDENKEKINTILKFIAPHLQIGGEGDTNEQITKVLDQFYPDIGDEAVYQYNYLDNQAKNEKAKQGIKDEYCDIYEKFNFFKKYCFYNYKTPVWNLIKLYEKTDSQDLTIYELIKKIGKSLDVSDWYDYIYETYADDFDSESFNNSVGYYIDKALDKVEEDNIAEVREVYDEITKKYKFNKWYDFPADKNKQFLILKIDLETAKLVVRMYGGNLESGTRKLSLEDFYNTIHNLSLF